MTKTGKKKNKSWFDGKLANPKFKEGFELEYEKISIAEQLAKFRLNADLTEAVVNYKIKA
jgi:hypothetical protein